MGGAADMAQSIEVGRKYLGISVDYLCERAAIKKTDYLSVISQGESHRQFFQTVRKLTLALRSLQEELSDLNSDSNPQTVEMAHSLISEYAIKNADENCILEFVEQEEILLFLKDMIHQRFSPREIGIFRLYIQGEKTFKDIAEKYEISNARVAQLYRNSIKKLAKSIKSREDKIKNNINLHTIQKYKISVSKMPSISPPQKKRKRKKLSANKKSRQESQKANTVSKRYNAPTAKKQAAIPPSHSLQYRKYQIQYGYEEPTHSNEDPWDLILLIVRAFFLIFIFLFIVFAYCRVYAFTLYGYQDASGTIHLSETKLDDNYVLLKDSPVAPRLTIQEARRLIRIKHAIQNGSDSVIHRHVFKTKAGIFHYPALITNKSILSCIEIAGQRYNLDPALLYAVIEQESRFQANAVSPKGAMGMMQLMPETARQWGLRHPFDPEENILAGAKHLRWLFDKFSNVKLALAAYNAGHANVIKYGGVPPFPETKLYVSRIMERYQILQGG